MARMLLIAALSLLGLQPRASAVDPSVVQPSVAESPATQPSATSEPLFCSDPVDAVCERLEAIKADYSALEKKLEAQGKDRAAALALLGSFKQIEKESVIPSFEETRSRLIAGLEVLPGLEVQRKIELKSTIGTVKFVSLSGAPEAADRLKMLSKRIPKNSILLKEATPENVDIIKNFRLERLGPDEREFLQLLLQTLALRKAQKRGCGESVPLNAFSLGSQWGVPAVAVCMETMIALQPVDVQVRYPILGMVFAHEFGHQLHQGQRMGLYSKYLGCLKESPFSPGPPSDHKGGEMVADFWSAVALGNMLKTRAALLDEPAETERNRALRFVRGSLQWLCEDPGGHDHPSANFRIGAIFGQDPEIRRMLGCKPKPGCGLEGKRP
jgi:hypothetical protein